MTLLICILIIVYIASIPLLAIRYGEKGVTPNLWSILSLVVPVLNTVLFIMLSPKNQLKTFINEIKNKRKK